MPMLTARTLAEGRVYAGLMADDDAEAGETLTEGEQSWTLASGGTEVEVPYASDQVARRAGATFGLGVSQLVDAGQWVLVASTYADRAVDAAVRLGAATAAEDDVRGVELTWAVAADAIGEALKFLPDGAAELPDEAFWSEAGTQARADQPERFTRDQLVDDLEYYRGALDDFRAAHGLAGQG